MSKWQEIKIGTYEYIKQENEKNNGSRTVCNGTNRKEGERIEKKEIR